MTALVRGVALGVTPRHPRPDRGRPHHPARRPPSPHSRPTPRKHHMTTTNERVRQTIQRIDAALAEPETVCLRPGCNATALPWLSPWCTPECLRLHHQATHIVMTERITTGRTIDDGDARTELAAAATRLLGVEQCQCAVLGHMAPCSWCTNPANPLNAPDSEIATATRELARRIDLAPNETHSVPTTGGILFAGPILTEPDRPTWRQRLLNGIRKRPW